MSKTIAIIASLDTKGNEVEYARNLIANAGLNTLLIDTGVRFAPTVAPDITSREVIESAGFSWQDLLESDKGKRIDIMTAAITGKIKELYEQGKFDAVYSMGGAQNTTMATSAMKALPLGVPKLMLTTIASGTRQFEPLIGTKDILVMHSVADISGINFITKSIIDNAVAAVVGMVNNGSGKIVKPNNIVVGATMLGITDRGVVQATRLLQDSGCEIVTFHANGVGGRSLEDLIHSGMVDVVLDMTLHEITSEFFGGYCSGATGRLEAAGKAGIPQVLIPGAIDMLDYGVDSQGAPAPQVADRINKYYHNSKLVHAKLTKEEIGVLADVIAKRANESKGPVTVIIPLKGFCEAGAPGGKLCDPSIDGVLIDILRQNLKKGIRVIEVDRNINDEEFSRIVAEAVLSYCNA